MKDMAKLVKVCQRLGDEKKREMGGRDEGTKEKREGIWPEVFSTLRKKSVQLKPMGIESFCCNFQNFKPTILRKSISLKNSKAKDPHQDNPSVSVPHFTVFVSIPKLNFTSLITMRSFVNRRIPP